MTTKKDKVRLDKNAEVTTKGIKSRGTNSTQTLVTVNSTSVGVTKKMLIASTFLLMATGNFIGIAIAYEPNDLMLINAAWATGSVAAVGLTTLFFAKVA